MLCSLGRGCVLHASMAEALQPTCFQSKLFYTQVSKKEIGKGRERLRCCVERAIHIYGTTQQYCIEGRKEIPFLCLSNKFFLIPYIIACYEASRYVGKILN